MIKINNMHINVLKSGSGKENIILLHGWGHSSAAFKGVQDYLENKFTVYNLDLPGFGLSDKPDSSYRTEDYANVLRGVIEAFNIVSPTIIGHSFGGRVAIKYTSMYKEVKRLVLVDSAGIVHKKKLSYYMKVYSYKTLKHLFSLPFLRKFKTKVLGKFGSADYKNADPVMKRILTNVVNEDLRSDLDKITNPTLLVWGTNDTATPLSDAYIMKEHLKDGGIVEIKNGSHFSYLDDFNLFLRVLDAFLL